MFPGFQNENTILRAGDRVDIEYDEAISRIQSEIGRSFPLIVGGEEVYTAQALASYDPSTGRNLGHFGIAGRPHVDRAIVAAKRAQIEWERLGHERRAEILELAARLLRDARPRLAAIVTLESGKDRVEAYYDVDEAIDFVKFYAHQMRSMAGFTTMLGEPFPGEACASVMRPWGVFAAVGPFNFPAAIPTGMISAALITGNAVVLKPSVHAPWTAYEIVRIFHAAGVPSPILSLLTGDGPGTGRLLLGHPGLDGVVFTGSKEVGIDNYARFVAQRPRPFIAEMGGKNATVVTANADLDVAADGIVRSAFAYAGQKCSATSRVYIHQDIYDGLVSLLVDRTRALRTGLPWVKGTNVGPLINRSAFARWEAAISVAKADGGVIAVGGGRPTTRELASGHFVEPTIVLDLPIRHEAFRSEYFAPFLAVARYSSNEEVIREVNATEFGLTLGVMSEDPSEVAWFCERAEVGVFYANRGRGSSSGAMVGGQSFGGWKFSGTTGRGAGGPWYLLQFMREQSRTIVSHMGREPTRRM